MNVNSIRGILLKARRSHPSAWDFQVTHFIQIISQGHAGLGPQLSLFQLLLALLSPLQPHLYPPCPWRGWAFILAVPSTSFALPQNMNQLTLWTPFNFLFKCPFEQRQHALITLLTTVLLPDFLSPPNSVLIFFLYILKPSKIYFCCLVTKSCLTLFEPVDCSMLGFPVLHYLLEFAQTHVHWVSDVIYIIYMYIWGFLGCLDGRVCLQCWRSGFDPWVGKSPWRRKWQPTPVFLPGKSHGQRSLVAYNPWGRKESDMTEQLHFIYRYIYKKYTLITYLFMSLSPN